MNPRGRDGSGGRGDHRGRSDRGGHGRSHRTDDRSLGFDANTNSQSTPTILEGKREYVMGILPMIPPDAHITMSIDLNSDFSGPMKLRGNTKRVLGILQMMQPDADTDVSLYDNTNDQSTPIIIKGPIGDVVDIIRRMSSESHVDMSFRQNSTAFKTLTTTKRNTGDEERPKSKRRTPDLRDPEVCGNCGVQDHKAAFCAKPGASGWMEACPKCDSTKHLYEMCPQRNKGEEDFVYLVYNRQRKPPVKSSLKLGKVIDNELARIGTRWRGSQVMELPYSAQFAIKEAQKRRPERWGYPHVGKPSEEAKRRIPEPDRTNLTLWKAARVLDQQSWSRHEVVNPPEDGRISTIRSAGNGKEYKRSRSQSFNGDLPYSKRRNLMGGHEPSPGHFPLPRGRRSPPKDLYPRVKSEDQSPERDGSLRGVRPVGNPIDFSVDFYDDGADEQKS